MRDNFPKLVREVLAKRVSYLCSNPNCRKVTVGSHSTEDGFINLGVAAHITAASKGGPRFCETMQPGERKSIRNGIWLCQSCAKLVDSDTQMYSTSELVKWRLIAEKHSLSVISNESVVIDQAHSLFENRIKVYQRLFYEVRNTGLLIDELIITKKIPVKEKREIATYLCLQIARFTDDNCFYLQNEIIVQCIGTFIGIADVFSLNKEVSKKCLDNYSKNLRASQILLKSVNSQGLINTSKKTKLMAFYTDLEAKQQEKDFSS